MSLPSQFTPEAAASIVRAVRGDQRRPKATAIPDRRGYRTPQVRPKILAVLTTDVTARTGDSPSYQLGSGTATLLWVDRSGGTQAEQAGVTVWNALRQPIDHTITDLVQVALVDGLYVIDAGDCQ